MLEIDGSRFSGSGSIIRQAAAYAAVTGRAVRVTNARRRRPQPGLRRQHVKAVEAVRDLVGGRLAGVDVGSRDFTFHPGDAAPEGAFRWDVGSAGSATALACSLLPVLARRGRGVEFEVRGGLFQDFAPSEFHLEHVLAPLLAGMGFPVSFELVRPGYVPRGEGVLRVTAPAVDALSPLVALERGDLRRVWGISLASHLDERRVGERMAAAAGEVLAAAGVDAVIDRRGDDTAAQPGAAFALFAEFATGSRLGADGAGAPRRRAEEIGRRVTRALLDEIASGASVDRFAGDQVIGFAALAAGSSAFRVAEITEHMETARWLASLFFGVSVHFDAGGTVSVEGAPPAASDRRDRA